MYYDNKKSKQDILGMSNIVQRKLTDRGNGSAEDCTTSSLSSNATPTSTTGLKSMPGVPQKRDTTNNYHDETMPFLSNDYDVNNPRFNHNPISTNKIHNNGSVSSGNSSYPSGGASVNCFYNRNKDQNNRIINTDVEDLSSDEHLARTKSNDNDTDVNDIDYQIPVNNDQSLKSPKSIDHSQSPNDTKRHRNRHHSNHHSHNTSRSKLIPPPPPPQTSQPPLPSELPPSSNQYHPQPTSALLTSIPPPPSEPPPSTPRDSYCQDSNSIAPGHNQLPPYSTTTNNRLSLVQPNILNNNNNNNNNNYRANALPIMDQHNNDQILHQIPGVLDQETSQLGCYPSRNQYNSTNMFPMGTLGRYRGPPGPSITDNTLVTSTNPGGNGGVNQALLGMATLPHHHSQSVFNGAAVPRAPGSVGGNSNVYENPYNSLNRQSQKQQHQMKTMVVGPLNGGPGPANPMFPNSTSTQDMLGAFHHMLYRQGSADKAPMASLHHPQHAQPPQHNTSFSADPLFGLSKGYHGPGAARCTWTCIRIALFVLAILLLLSLIAYFAAKSVWLEGRLNKRFAQDPVVIGLFNKDKLPEVLAQPVSQRHIQLQPMGVWSGRWMQNTSGYVQFNFSIDPLTSLGIFLRINSVPTIVRYSFFDRVSGKAWRPVALDRSNNQQSGSIAASNLVKRSKRSVEEDTQESTGFIHFLEKGLWFVSVVNDQPREENIKFALNSKVKTLNTCPEQCNEHGICTENGLCQCLTGFKGKDCSIVDRTEVCTGHGNYFRGQCICNAEWKGIECNTLWYECEYPTCAGHGYCVSGSCMCQPGFTGVNCTERECPNSCSGKQGLCNKISGECKCFNGWTGQDCSEKIDVKLLSSNNGKLLNCKNGGIAGNNICKCPEGFSGRFCETSLCQPSCLNGGQCTNHGLCRCLAGFTGDLCGQKLCDNRCYKHGKCTDQGNCVCNEGWFGKHCSLDGCPNKCGRHGKCTMNASDLHSYKCQCDAGWKGQACNVTQESLCTDGQDNDNDGLVDCEDPDCCQSKYCIKQTKEKSQTAGESCPVMQSLKLLLLTTKLARPGSPFYEQIEFLTKRKYTASDLDKKKISVVRGRIVQSDGSPFQGCRIQDRSRLINGHTFTDEKGTFDLVVQGGGAVQLEIIRYPALRFTGYLSIYVPINEFVNIGDFVLPDSKLVQSVHSNDEFCQTVHDPTAIDGPILLADWSSHIVPLYDDLNGENNGRTVQDRPLSFSIDNGVLINTIPLKETGLHLMHRSSRVSGYKSSLLIYLLGKRVPKYLKEIRLQIDVAGQMLEKRLEPDPFLTFTFYWDRMNAYNRRMYGIAVIKVKAGYIYENCSKIFWETKMTKIIGYDLAAKDIGNWNLNNRHIYDFNHGIVYRGDGSHLFLTEIDWIVRYLAGTKYVRRSLVTNDDSTCVKCEGDSSQARFYSLHGVLSDDRGRVIIADGGFIRVLAGGISNTQARQMMAPFRLRFLFENDVNSDSGMSGSSNSVYNAVIDQQIYLGLYDPLSSTRDNYLVSSTTKRSIWIVNPTQETYRHLIGESCMKRDCIKERLVAPRGIAMTYNNTIYFVDGRSIQMISMKSMTVHTIVGDSSSLASHALLPPCGQSLQGHLVRLRWPTVLKYNPVDSNIYFVDNMDSVYKLNLETNMISLVVGNPQNCPYDIKEDDPLKQARHSKFNDIRDIDISPIGELYIAEKSDVWKLQSDGYLYNIASSKSGYTTNDDTVQYFNNRNVFDSISSISISMFGEIIVADNKKNQVFYIHYKLPEKINNQYNVLSPDTREVYTFNLDGQHISTQSSITGTPMYSLQFRLHSINGWLSKIISPSEKLQFQVHRDTKSRPTRLETPSAVSYKVKLDTQKRITELSTPSCFWKFDYNSQDLLTSLLSCGESVPHRFTYDLSSGRLLSIIRPSGTTTQFDAEPRLNTLNYLSGNQLIHTQTSFSNSLLQYQLISSSLTSDYLCVFARANCSYATGLQHWNVIGPAKQLSIINNNINSFNNKITANYSSIYNASVKQSASQILKMSLLDSTFKLQKKTYTISYNHLRNKNGFRFSREIVFQSKSNDLQWHKSDWIYQITLNPRQTRSYNRARSLALRQSYYNSNRVARDYLVSNVRENERSNFPRYLPLTSTNNNRRYPRTFKINGKKKLQVLFDGETNTEAYLSFNPDGSQYDLFYMKYNADYLVIQSGFTSGRDHNDFISIDYADSGEVREVKWKDKTILNIRYDFYNRTIKITNAFINEQLDYVYSDTLSNQIVSIMKNNQQSVYKIQYSNSSMTSCITPNKIQISVQQIIGVSFNRIIYQPYGIIDGYFLYDFEPVYNSLLKISYPSRLYSIRFKYRDELIDSVLTQLNYGSEQIDYLSNDIDSSIIQEIRKIDKSSGVAINQSANFLGPLVNSQRLSIDIPAPITIGRMHRLVGRTQYNYDTDWRMKSIHFRVNRLAEVVHNDQSGQDDPANQISVQINRLFDDLDRIKREDQFHHRYSLNNGGIGLEIVLQDRAVVIESRANSLGLLESRQLSMQRVNSQQRYNFSLDIHYSVESPLTLTNYKLRFSHKPTDNINVKFSYRPGSVLPNDVVSSEYISYKYFEDGRLQSLQINSGATIKYIYDERRGLLQQCGLVSYRYDPDGFLTQRRVGGQKLERFRYNSLGQLVEFEWGPSSKTTDDNLKNPGDSNSRHVFQYVYDGQHRLVLRRNMNSVTSQGMIRLHYLDPAHPEKITHYIADGRSIQLYYDDLHGHLYAMKVEKQLFMILSDYQGSPRLVIDANTVDIVWQCNYDVFGEPQLIKSWSLARMIIGFQGKFWDSEANLLLMSGTRPYFPSSRSYGSFDVFGMVNQLANLKLYPNYLNSFMLHLRHSPLPDIPINTPDYWLSAAAINKHILINKQSHHDLLKLPSQYILKDRPNQLSALFGTQIHTKSVYSMISDHEAASFSSLSTLETSRLLAGSSQLVPWNLACIIPPESHSLLGQYELDTLRRITSTASASTTTNTQDRYLSVLLHNSTVLGVYDEQTNTAQIPIINIVIGKTQCSSLDDDLRQLGLTSGEGTSGQSSHSNNLSITRSPSTTVLWRGLPYFKLHVKYCLNSSNSNVAQSISQSIAHLVMQQSHRIFWASRRKQVARHDLLQQQQILYDLPRQLQLQKYGLLHKVTLQSWFDPGSSQYDYSKADKQFVPYWTVDASDLKIVTDK